MVGRIWLPPDVREIAHRIPNNGQYPLADKTVAPAKGGGPND